MANILNGFSVQTVAVAVLLYFASLAVYRLFFHPLAKFPGPKLATVTRYYEGYYDVVQNGQYTFRIAELHKQYGPIVRISPHELHVSDPAFFEKLYRQDGQWDKYAWAYDAFGAPHSAICTTDHNMHKKRRATLNAYFSKANVSSQQEIIERSVNKLRDRIKEYAVSATSVNLGVAISAMTTDVATEFILGESYNNLDRKDFNQEMTNMLQGSGGMWRMTKHVRFLGPLMKAIPLSMLEKSGDPNVAAFVAFLKTSKKRVQELVTEINAKHDAQNGVPSRTLVQAILESPNLPPSEKALPRLNDEIETITGAGLETTAQALRLIVYYLYSNPQMLTRLRSELRAHAETLPSGEQSSLAQLEQLPYLTAVLMEGLRLAPGIATRMARIAPDRDLVYAERWTIPAGTPVGMSIILMHLDEDLYPDPYKFNPDRWADLAERKGDVGRTFAPFSRGTRICLGMNLAWAELYFTMAMLVSNFNFDLGDTSAEEVDCFSDQFIPGTKSPKGVRVTASLC